MVGAPGRLTPLERRIVARAVDIVRNEVVKSDPDRGTVKTEIVMGVTEGLHLFRTIFRIEDFTECVGLSEDKLRLQDNRGKYGYLRNALTSIKKRRIFIGVKGEYRLNPYKFGEISDIGRIGVGGGSEGTYAGCVDGAKALLSEYLEGLGESERRFHDVMLNFYAPGIYSYFTTLREAGRLSWGWSWCWDEVRRRGNKKFVKRREGYLGFRSFMLQVDTTDTVEGFVESSEACFTLDPNGMVELLEIMVCMRGSLLADVGRAILVPPVVKWVIVQWHGNRDGLRQVTGPAFNLTFQDCFDVVYRLYVKESKGGERYLRAEKIEEVRRTWEDQVKMLLSQEGPREVVNVGANVGLQQLHKEISEVSINMKQLVEGQRSQQETNERLAEIAQRLVRPDEFRNAHERIIRRKAAGVA